MGLVEPINAITKQFEVEKHDLEFSDAENQTELKLGSIVYVKPQKCFGAVISIG